MRHRALRLVARLTEALGLPILAGLLFGLLGLSFGRLPLVFPALLGLLAGGAATMRTLGVQISDRRWRMSLATLAAVLGLGVGHVVDYQRFIHDQRAHHLALDYRRSPAEVDGLIDQSLRTATACTGLLGYQLATIQFGAAIGPWRVAGIPLVLLRLLETAIAVGLARRAAGGPAPLLR